MNRNDDSVKVMTLMRQYVLSGLCAIGVGLSSCAKKNTETQVIEWLGEFSYSEQHDYLHGRAKPVNYDRWIARGNRIQGAEPVLRRLLEDNDPRVELPQVASALARVGDQNSVPVLTNALRHANWHVRREAAVALGKIGDNRALEPLSAMLKQDPDSNLRANAAQALGKFAWEEAIPALKSALDDEDLFVRELAAEALAKVYQRALCYRITNRTHRATSVVPKGDGRTNDIPRETKDEPKR
jgi:HEAT repeat protein